MRSSSGTTLTARLLGPARFLLEPTDDPSPSVEDQRDRRQRSRPERLSEERLITGQGVEAGVQLAVVVYPSGGGKRSARPDRLEDEGRRRRVLAQLVDASLEQRRRCLEARPGGQLGERALVAKR